MNKWKYKKKGWNGNHIWRKYRMAFIMSCLCILLLYTFKIVFTFALWVHNSDFMHITFNVFIMSCLVISNLIYNWNCFQNCHLMLYLNRWHLVVIFAPPVSHLKEIFFSQAVFLLGEAGSMILSCFHCYNSHWNMHISFILWPIDCDQRSQNILATYILLYRFCSLLSACVISRWVIVFFRSYTL
jgi:hypothetical protein